MRQAPAWLAAAALLAVTGCGGGGEAASPRCTAAVPGRAALSLAPEQALNAATIAGVGKRLGLPDHAVTVALVTALQESGLHNLSYGDRDSLGLFQQRPSQGWGAPAQILVPRLAAATFYAHLAKVPGWQSMDVTVAAQAVQHSAAPAAYAQWESQARVLAGALTGEFPAGLACAHLAQPTPLRAAALREEAAADLGPDGLGARGGNALWAAATWLVAHAQVYGVRTVTAGTRRWDAASGAWRPRGQAGPLSFG